jgi:hypothetical protein
MRASLLLGSLLVLAACEGPPPKPANTASASNDGVPANSLSETRLSSGTEQPKPSNSAGTPTPSLTQGADPTHPYVQKVGDSPSDPSEKPSDKPGKPGKGGKKGDKMTKQECEAVLDKFMDLEFAENPKLRGLPPDVIPQVKQQAREMAREKDSADCNATRVQYNCAMSAASTTGWKQCMK